jgi:hypothetical protein
MNTHPYPVHVDATLQPDLSRWLWLVKWILVIPHYVVLAFLWLAFLVMTVVAFVAILATGRYPRAIFDFNVGVLRWSWRVAYYAYGGLGTDQYPPFSLDERPDYPAHLDVAYPEHLSRGLALVKWWLLAIPHYLVLALFVGGGWYVASGQDEGLPGVWGWGLIQLLVFVAGVVLLVTGSYPRGVFDFVLGLNRWVLRVAAYASLMTDSYPPFRLDMGGVDPGSGGGVDVHPAPATEPTAPVTPPSAPPPAAGTRRWSAGRIVAVVVTSLMVLTSLGLLAAGTMLKLADSVARDTDGYLTSSTVELQTPGHALVTDDVEIRNDTTVVDLPERLIGTAKIEVNAGEGDVFVGIADSGEADAYLAGVARSTVTDVEGVDHDPAYEFTDGGAPSLLPEQADIWETSAAGPGIQEVRFTPEEGDWTVVVMNADGAAPVETSVRLGATLPLLDDLAYGLLIAGAVLLAGGGVGLWLALRRS